ncbi:MAG TPA: sigma 54-interacting transcriptional regulator [Candidatus Wallbacteria bacterium]|nr:sigma 54-interacting transcriptional regulator [Candidatus Wallbacteria bacterium]
MKKNYMAIDQILDFLDDGIFTVDRDFKITSFNRAAEKITGVSEKDALDKNCAAVFNTPLCKSACPLKEAIKKEKQTGGVKIQINTGAGKALPICVTAGPLYGRDGSVTGGIEIFRDISGIENLKKELDEKYSHYDIVGKSEYMKTLFNILPDIAESDCNVLIEGPSGSGKSLAAKTIHNLSERSKKPFIVINCGALPETLLESELFGYARGAFTDAKKDKPGRFALAEGGTIFLDEIAEMPFHLQVKLLRVIEDRRYEPLGGVKTRNADVRIIAATNKDLGSMVKKEKFREDLYYRLKIVNLRMPALAERREDIEMLARHFIKNFNARKSNKITEISPKVLEFFAVYDFPGNVRELENILEYCYIFCKDGKLLPDHLPADCRSFVSGIAALSPKSLKPSPLALERAVENTEKVSIVNALERFEGDKKSAARFLKIDYSTLWRKMKKYSLN